MTISEQLEKQLEQFGQNLKKPLKRLTAANVVKSFVS